MSADSMPSSLENIGPLYLSATRCATLAPGPAPSPGVPSRPCGPRIRRFTEARGLPGWAGCGPERVQWFASCGERRCLQLAQPSVRNMHRRPRPRERRGVENDDAALVLAHVLYRCRTPEQSRCRSGSRARRLHPSAHAETKPRDGRLGCPATVRGGQSRAAARAALRNGVRVNDRQAGSTPNNPADSPGANPGPITGQTDQRLKIKENG